MMLQLLTVVIGTLTRYSLKSGMVRYQPSYKPKLWPAGLNHGPADIYQSQNGQLCKHVVRLHSGKNDVSGQNDC